jgi:hypothetical protein
MASQSNFGTRRQVDVTLTQPGLWAPQTVANAHRLSNRTVVGSQSLRTISADFVVGTAG